jgi:hypothetical protein
MHHETIASYTFPNAYWALSQEKHAYAVGIVIASKTSKMELAMSRYQITNQDLIYAAEFKEKPFGYHSPGLQRVLNSFRGGPVASKYILVVLEPFKRWALARLPGQRGMPVEIIKNQEFTDLAVAEWAVFKLRWKSHTGDELDL